MSSLDPETAAKNGLRVGGELTDDELHELLSASARRMAEQKAMQLLTLRSHCQRELVKKLSREFGQEAAEEAAARMAELGLVDDEAYARDMAEELLVRRGYSVRRAGFEMTRRGLGRELTDRVLGDLRPDPDEAAARLLEKKYPGGLRDERERRRAFALLRRYGYDFDAIRRAVGRWSTGGEGSDGDG